MKYLYTLFFFILFFLLKYFLLINEPSGTLGIDEYRNSVSALLEYLPVVMLIFYIQSSQPYRYNGLVVSICLVLLNVTFPLTIKFGLVVTNLGQQNFMKLDGSSIFSPILVHYTLLVLFFLLIAFFFFIKKRFEIVKLLLFALFAVFVTTAVAVISMESVNQFKKHKTDIKSKKIMLIEPVETEKTQAMNSTSANY